jgi:hypothetical protein
MTHSDTKLLQILLNLPPGKLSVSERKAFQAMYDDLVNGKYISLSRKQRSWAEQIYMKHELHRNPLPKLKRVETKDKQKAVLDLGPLPLKPPGR